MTFGQRVFLKRKEKGLTQQQLADLMGFNSRSSIYRIEEDKSDIPASKLPLLAKTLNTTPSYLLGFEDEDKWISVDDALPKCEEEVFIATKRFNGYKVLTTAMYEDGTLSVDESSWHWDDIDFNYDEENDCYLIPCGWWEYRHYGECLNYAVDDKVTHWMPIPRSPSE